MVDLFVVRIIDLSTEGMVYLFVFESTGRTVQYKLNAQSLRIVSKTNKHFLYFRAIQGQSGGTLVDLTLQDNVLLPDDFAEYIYHVGNAHDMHSIIQADARKKAQEGQAGSVFHCVNPMYANQYLEEVQYDLDKPRITVYIKYLERSPKYMKLVQSEARSKKRIAVLSNSIARTRSFHRTSCDLY